MTIDTDAAAAAAAAARGDLQSRLSFTNLFQYILVSLSHIQSF